MKRSALGPLRLLCLWLWVAMLVRPVVAQTTSWTNPGTADWFNAANWSGGVPTAGTVGQIGNGGTALIQSGSAFSLVFSLGNSAGESGTVTVTGPGSRWENIGYLYVGYYGAGTLNIENGGVVTKSLGFIGAEDNSNSTVTVTGPGSRWENTSLVVAHRGTGTLNIENGGVVTNNMGFMGVYSGSSGTVMVSGAHSRWENSDFLQVGYAGTGTLNVENSGVVTNTIGYIGHLGDSNGTVTVTGGGSRWENSNYLHVGNYGAGTLNIENGGTVEVAGGAGTLSMGVFGTSTGTLNMGTGAAAGVLHAAEVQGGAGTAVLNFNHTEVAYTFSPKITGTTSVNHLGSGTTVLAGANTYSGNTVVSNGTLASGNLPNSSLSLSGGNFSPGNVGTVQTVTMASLSLTAGSLLMDLAAGGVSDHLTVTDGLASLTAPVLFTFNNLGAEQATYHLIDGLDIANPWDTGLLSFTGLGGGDAIGVFILSDDLSELLFYFSPNGNISGPLLQNSSPVNIPSYATFLVNGAARTGAADESNIIKALIFNPGSSLQVFNNLTVTSGNFTVNSGRASINGGHVFVPGDFHKHGGGTLVTNTVLQVGGSANIHQGALFVNGTMEADRVNVFRGTLLGGSGVIVGDVFNSGTVAPGNSPGTLTIIGNYTQTKFGTLQIEVASEKVFDRLVVRGTARLDGTLDIRNYRGNTLSYGQQVPFLQAGRIVGSFDEILMPQDDLFRGRFINAGHTGILLVAPTSYTLVAETPNQTRVAHALDRWIGIEDGDIGAVTLALDLLTAEQYPAAFEAIMPGYYEAALSTGIELSQSQGQLLFQQLSSRRLGRKPQAPAPAASAALVSDKGTKNVAPVPPRVAIDQGPQWNAWMQGSGLFSEGGLSLNPGEDFESGTFMVGADFAVGEHVSLGVFASYQEGWGDYNSGGDTDLESVRFGGYATFDYEGFYASGSVGGGTTDYSVKRPIEWATLDRTARSDPDGTEFFTLLGTGYDFHVGNFTFGPSLSAQYTKLKIDEFTESGADTLDLRVRDAEEESLRTYLGGRIAYTLKVSDRLTVIPELRAFWEHEFLQGGESLSASLNGGSGPEFNYVTEEPGKDAMYVGAGLNFLVGESLTTSVYYHANFGRNDDAQHTVSVSVNWMF